MEYQCVECGYQWVSRKVSKPGRCGSYPCRSTAWEHGKDYNRTHNPHFIHGHARKNGRVTLTYRCWQGAKTRCSNPRDRRWKDYGGRGIDMCKRWRDSYNNFLADMGEKPKGMTLDRIDTNGNYEPSNCRWATPKQQQNNIRRNRVFTINGVRRTLMEWVEHYGLSYGLVETRLRRGWTIQQALMIPTMRGWKVSPRPILE